MAIAVLVTAKNSIFIRKLNSKSIFCVLVDSKKSFRILITGGCLNVLGWGEMSKIYKPSSFGNCRVLLSTR